jgi:hypothetical protein
VERVGGSPAVRRRVGQWPDDFEKLDDRAWPAVRDDERQGIGVLRADVEEVDAETVDDGAELRQRVQSRLGCPPVVPLGPVP